MLCLILLMLMIINGMRLNLCVILPILIVMIVL